MAREGGSEAIAKLTPYLQDIDNGVRIDAAGAIAGIGGKYSIDPLVAALRDNDPEVQLRATAGLVNFYLPGYLQTGLSAPVRRAGSAIVSRFTSDGNDQIVPAYVDVREDVIAGLGKVAGGAAGMEARAAAARALGILRGRAALPDLVSALRSKDTNVIYESVVAIRKIGDPSAGPPIAFLLHDLTDKVELAAIETTGILKNAGALESLRDVYSHPRNAKVKRATLTAIAQMPEARDGALLEQCRTDPDPEIRAAAAEVIGRLGDPAAMAGLQASFEQEDKPQARLGFAFAVALLGNRDMSEFAPLRYLVNQLNSAAWRDAALGYLVELARQREVRQSLYPAIREGSKAEKTGIAQVLAASGDDESIPYVEKLSRERDSEVAHEGIAALRILKARSR